jgi:hypothetical protein
LGSALFGLSLEANEFATGANWASQGTKWFVIFFANQLTNGFGMGSVDFHWKQMPLQPF